MTKTKRNLCLIIAVLVAVIFAVCGIGIIISNNDSGSSIDRSPKREVKQHKGVENFIITDDGTLVGVRNWDSDYDIELVIPASVKTIAATPNTSGTVTIHGQKIELNNRLPQSNIVSIRFEDKSQFEAIEDGSFTDSVATSSAFGACGNLLSVEFPNNNKNQYIGAAAFFACYNTSVSDAAFGYYHGLRKVVFNSTAGVTIGSKAFFNCKTLRVVDSAYNVDSTPTAGTISTSAFEGCEKLYRVVLPQGIKTIKTRAFWNTPMLSDVSIPDAVEHIENSAFYDCGVTQVTLPTGFYFHEYEYTDKDGIKQTTTQGIKDIFVNCFRLVEIHNKSAHTAAQLISNSVLNIWGDDNAVTAKRATSNRSWMLRNKDGLVFCKNTAKTGSLVSGTNTDASYATDNWYVGAFADAYERRFTDANDAKLISFPAKITNDLERYSVKYSSIVGGSEIFKDNFSGEYDYLDEHGAPVKNNFTGLDVSEYDISQNAFRGLWLPYVDLSQGVRYVGNNAFCFSHSAAVVLGSNVKAIGTAAFVASAGNGPENGAKPTMTIYMPEGVTDYGSKAFYALDKNNYNGTYDRYPTPLIVFANKTDFASTSKQKCMTMVNNWSAPTGGTTKDCLYTYLIDIDYKIENISNGSKELLYTEQRLAGGNIVDQNGKDGTVKQVCSYDYVRQSNDKTVTDGNGDTYGNYKYYQWESMPEFSTELPTIEGNANSVWYYESGANNLPVLELESGTGAVKSNAITKMLQTSTYGSIEVFTYKLDLPSLDKNYEIVYNANSLATTAVLSELPADADIIKYKEYLNFELYTSRVSGIDIVPDAKTDDIRNAGNYFIGVSLNPLYGEWSKKTAYVPLAITPKEVDLNNKSLFNLYLTGTETGGTVDERDQLLESDTLSIYNEVVNGQTVSVPYLEKKGNDEPDSTITGMYTRDRGETSAIVGIKDMNGATEKVYSVSSYMYNKQNQVGIYTMTAELVPGAAGGVNNYKFIFGEDVFGPGGTGDNTIRTATFDGMSVTLTSVMDGASFTGKVRVEIVWYIVKTNNYFTTEDGSEYTVNSAGWTYGEDVAARIEKPRVFHGTADDVLFKLDFRATGNSAAITVTGTESDKFVSVSAFGEYINNSMPAGAYSITYKLPEFIDNETPYAEMIRSYDFTIGRKSLSALDNDPVETVNEYLKGKLFQTTDVAAAQSGYLFDAPTGDVLTSFETFGYGKAGDTGTDSIFVSREGVWRTEAYNGYFKPFKITYNLLSQQSSVYNSISELGNYIPKSIGTYVVYYQIQADNYEPLTDITSEARRNYVFYTLVYHEVEKPEITENPEYTGSVIHPVQSNEYYTATYASDAGYINVKKDGNVVDYTVDIALRNSTLYRWKGERETSGSTDPVIKPWGDGAPSITYKDDFTITFNIEPAGNTSTMTPTSFGWVWNTYDANRNGFNWQTRFVTYDSDSGTVNPFTFKIINNDTHEEYDKDSFADAPAGTYEIVAYCPEDEAGNWKEITAYGSMQIFQATNGWAVTPSVIGWSWGSVGVGKTMPTVTLEPTYYNKATNAKGEYESVILEFFDGTTSVGGKFNLKYATGTKNVIIPDTVLTELAKLTSSVVNKIVVHNYTLKITVNGSNDYGDLTPSVPFVITEAVNTWINTPNVYNWNYKQFETKDISSAKPQYFVGFETDPDGYFTEVSYKILKDSVVKVDSFNFGKDGTISETVKDSIIALDVGSYSLVITVNGEAGKYNKLEQTIPFSIGRAQVSQGGTAITGWTYKEYKTGSIKLDIPEESKATTSYVIKPSSGDNEDYASTTALETRFATLGAGSYTLEVTVADTDNYTGITFTLNFAVGKANNAWDPSPFITETGKTEHIDTWTYGTDYAVNNGAAKVSADNGQSGSFSIWYYYADNTNGLVADMNRPTEKPSAVGIYCAIVKFEGLDNYEPLIEQLFFTITQATVTIKLNEASLEFEYGTANVSFGASTAPSLPTGASLAYRIDSAETWTVYSDTALKAALARLDAGSHSLYITVQNLNDNYSLTGDLEIPVTISKKALMLSYTKVDYAWTYGVTADIPTNVEYTLTGLVNSDNVTLKYKTGDGEYVTFGGNLGDLFGNRAAGDYTFTVTAESKNYTCNEVVVTVAVAKVDVTLGVETGYTQSWTWVWNAGDREDKIGEITVSDNNVIIRFAVDDGASYEYSHENLTAAVKDLDAGEHTVRFSIGTANEKNYRLKNDFAVSISIDRAANAITMKKSDNVTAWSGDAAWTWGAASSDITAALPSATATHGVLSYAFVSTANDTAHGTISGTFTRAGIEKVHPGIYFYVITAEKNGNWTDAEEWVKIVISKAANDWTADPDITLDGKSLKVADGSRYEWSYGSSPAFVAASTHGDFTVTYYNADGTKYGDGTQIPQNVGNYKAGFAVAEHEDYQGIAEIKLDLSIVRKLETGWQSSPKAIGWTWGEYDKTVNLFSAVPRTGGNVKFTVLDGSGKTVLDKISLESNGTVSAAAESILKKLTADTYKLVVYVDETSNYSKFDNSAEPTEFTVETAKNEWTTIPNITTWTYGAYSPDYVPVAIAKYGIVEIVVKDKDGKEVYRAEYNSETKEQHVGYNGLSVAQAGTCTLIASVRGKNDCYDGIDEVKVRFEIFTSSLERPANHWTIIPSISNWEVGTVAPEPKGEALRGDVTFGYYVAVRGDDGIYTVGEKLAEQPSSVGYYFLRAEAQFKDADGQVVDIDDMTSDFFFQIIKRDNRWKENATPQMQSYLLSDYYAGNIPMPQGSAMYGSTEFSYKKLGYEDSTAVKALPTEPGTYVMIARATDPLGGDPLVEYVQFTVSNGTNHWTQDPWLDGWSEEFDPLEPNGAAENGTIEYTYYTDAGDNTRGEKLDEKPTEEGKYIVVATVKAAGYDDLVREIPFTIEPAYDRSLINVNIALAVVACVFAGVVIYFAIRRYKEC